MRILTDTLIVLGMYRCWVGSQGRLRQFTSSRGVSSGLLVVRRFSKVLSDPESPLTPRAARAAPRAQTGLTPLHKAAAAGEVECVELLLAFGAPADARSAEVRGLIRSTRAGAGAGRLSLFVFLSG